MGGGGGGVQELVIIMCVVLLQCSCIVQELCHNHVYGVATVFLYSCPGFKSSVRERMLYSSCKEPVVDAIEQELGKTVSKKVCDM